jgi:hypothetical protein
MKESPHCEFESNVLGKYTILFNQYHAKIEKSHDDYKTIAHNHYVQEILKRHQLLQNSLGINSRFVLEIKETLLEDKSKNYENEFNSKWQLIKFKSKKVLLELAELEACDRIYELLKNKFNSGTDATALFSKIIWKSKIELEFVQLIYALYEAGYLDNEKSEVTWIVKEVAKLFNYQLGEHWQSNLSDSVNNRNADYQPKIFDKLKKGYDDYRVKQIEGKKRK